MEEWERLAWHIDGISWDRYLASTNVERLLLHETLTRLIKRVDEPRPKQMRR